MGENKIKEKEFGRAKIYLVNQDLYPEVSKSELAKLDDSIAAKRDNFNRLKNIQKDLLTQLKQVQSTPSNQ